MINRNLHSKTAVNPDSSEDFGQGYDLTAPPEAFLPPDPYENSTAMLGEPGPDSQGAVLPSEAGASGRTLGAMGMISQGVQILSMDLPGFVPMEITAWVQQGMQILPQLLQQMQTGIAAAGPGAGAMLGGPSLLGGAGPAQPPQPSGPPQRQEQY